MKKLLFLGVFALLTTMISCSADDFDNAGKTTNEIKKDTIKPSYATGPDDDPITVPPPPIKKP